MQMVELMWGKAPHAHARPGLLSTLTAAVRRASRAMTAGGTREGRSASFSQQGSPEQAVPELSSISLPSLCPEPASPTCTASFTTEGSTALDAPTVQPVARSAAAAAEVQDSDGVPECGGKEESACKEAEVKDGGKRSGSWLSWLTGHIHDAITQRPT